MRVTVYVCDHCNTDMTEDVNRRGEWQMFKASGTTEGGSSVDIEACSLDCLLAALGAKVQEST